MPKTFQKKFFEKNKNKKNNKRKMKNKYMEFLIKKKHKIFKKMIVV